MELSSSSGGGGGGDGGGNGSGGGEDEDQDDLRQQQQQRHQRYEVLRRAYSLLHRAVSVAQDLRAGEATEEEEDGGADFWAPVDTTRLRAFALRLLAAVHGELGGLAVAVAVADADADADGTGGPGPGPVWKGKAFFLEATKEAMQLAEVEISALDMAI